MSCIEIPEIERGFIIRDKESKIEEAALVVNSIHRLQLLNDKERQSTSILDSDYNAGYQSSSLIGCSNCDTYYCWVIVTI